MKDIARRELVIITNKNVDIKFSAHDTFLEYLSSGDTQSRKIGKPNNLKLHIKCI